MTENQVTNFGKYQVVKRLDEGAMGEVYMAYQPLLERRVAIKVLHPHLATGDDFVERFKTEASVVARLRHTNIMQVYDFDVEDNRYYMIMEFLDGPTLKEEMIERAKNKKSFTLYEIGYIVTALASALDYAHARGMIHRDIKPANIMFNGEGQVVLTDFGIVHIVADDEDKDAGQIIGTPAYMSPEQGAGLTVGAPSDIYSLGIVLYQLLTGELPFTADSAMSMVLKHVNEPVPPLRRINPEVPPAVEAAIMKALNKEVQKRYQRAESLAMAVRNAVGMTPEQALAAFSITAVPTTPPPSFDYAAANPETVDDDVTMISQSVPGQTMVVTGPGPYRGLFAFREHDSAFFFGREEFTEKLINLAHTQPLTVVAGPSGSGKSSVVFAGMVAGLRAESNWLIQDFRPASDPFLALAGGAVPLLWPTLDPKRHPEAIEKLAGQMRRGEVKFYRIIERLQQQNPDKKILMVIDQFEEIFTLCSDVALRHHFLDEILEAIDIQKFLPNQYFSFVLTLRADFLGQALGYRPLADALQGADVKLGPMSRDDLSRAITNPARRLGVEFEPGLVTRILNDVGAEPGNLPLLEFALAALWEQRRDKRLTHSAYESIGGVEGALARHANEIYERLTPEEQKQARHVFVQMVQPGEGTEDTRRVAIRAELGENNWKLIQKLADSRLVVTNVNVTGEETVEVVHEALIRTWGLLRRWMEEDRSFRSWQERLRQGLVQWQQSGRDQGALLRGVLLEQAKDWSESESVILSSQESTFIRASVDAVEKQAQEEEEARQRELEQAKQLSETRRRQVSLVRWAAVALSILLLAAIGAAIFAFAQQQQAANNAVEAELQSTAAFNAQETAVANELIAATRAAEAETARINAEDAQAESDELRVTAEFARGNAESAQAEAELERAAALRQSQIAQAQSLASQATNSLEQDADTELATLLALEAYRLNLESGGPVNWLIDSALRPILSDGFFNTTLIGHQHNVRSSAFSGNGQLLATASDDDSIRLWNLADTDAAPIVFTGHTEDVSAVVFGLDDETLISAGQDTSIRIWNIADSNADPFILNGESAVWAMAISPSKTILATAHNDRQVRVWDLNDLDAPPTYLRGHEGPLWSITFSPDRRYLASGGDDATVRIWDLDNLNTAPTVLTGHEGRVSTIIYSPDASQLVTGSYDNTVRVWSLEDNSIEPVVLRNHSDDVNAVAISPDGKTLASASRDWSVFLFDMADPLRRPVRHIRGHVDSVRTLSFSPDGNVLATGDNASFVRLWQVGKAPGAPEVLRGHSDRIWTVAYSPDGRLLASGSADLTLRIWQTSDLSIDPIILGGQTDGVRNIVFTPDNEWLLASSEDSQIRAWPVTNLSAEPIVLIGHEASVDSLALSRDGSMLASGSSDMTIRLWQINDGQFNLDSLLTGHEGPVLGLSFSPDGRYLASAGSDTMIRIYDLENPEDEPILLNHHTDKVTTIEFSPDGQLLASGSLDNTAMVWQFKALEEDPVILAAHNENVLDVVFSQDSSILATTSDDRAIILWNAHDLSETPTIIVGHESSVRSLAFDPLNDRFATVSNDQTVRIWPELSELVDVACSQIRRNLSQEEWIRYVGPNIPYNATCELP